MGLSHFSKLNSMAFQGLSRTMSIFKDFQGLKNQKKKIQGLSRTGKSPGL